MDQFRSIISEIKEMYQEYHEGVKRWDHTTEVDSENLILPPWLCQSYVRDSPENHVKKVEEKKKEFEEKMVNNNKRVYADGEGNCISRKKMKKLRRISRRPEKLISVSEKSFEKCSECVNPLGTKCIYKLCKRCCKDKCYLENLDCEGHRILVKTRREMAQFYARQGNKKEQDTSIS